MTVLYKLSVGSGAASRPVKRETVIADAVGDATDWLPLGQATPTIEVRAVTQDATDPYRNENLENGDLRKNQYNYRKSLDVYTAQVGVEVRNTNELDDQAGVFFIITGQTYINTMAYSELGDMVRLRILDNPAGDVMLMQMAARAPTERA